jgi:Fe-S cluster assembly iron-binding protein IscA
MLSSATTIHRFTPPTCTLEIQANQSTLARWTQKETVKNLHFKLSFDDPRVVEEEQKTICGDHLQLEQLYTATIDYVQNFLHQSFQSNNYIVVPRTDSNLPYIRPQGLVSHQLVLGSLAKNNSLTEIKLSAVQLFDLVTALEEYNSHIISLPQLNRDRRKRMLPVWGSMAAGAILVVGLAGIGVKLAQNQENSVASGDRDPSTVIPQLEEVSPPQVSETKENPTPQPKLTEPLSSAKKLPPPPPVDLPKPPPDIPDPAKYPLSEVGKQSGFEDLDSTETEEKTSIAIIPESKPSTTATPKTESPNITEEKDTTIAETPSIDEDNLSSRQQLEINPNLDNKLENNNNLDTALNSPVTPNSHLQEITKYFQEKWQPPAELKQSLEYSLILNNDGTISRVIPIGKVSKIYLDRTNIPLRGESFISPLTNNQSKKIRLLLSPDGEAIAFAE